MKCYTRNRKRLRRSAARASVDAPTLRKKGEVAPAPKEVKPETVSGFVDKIRDLSAKQFADNPSKLTSADIEVTVSTTDAKKTETVRIAGSAGARGDEPAFYELDPANVEAIKQAFDAIKEPEKPAADAKKK